MFFQHKKSRHILYHFLKSYIQKYNKTIYYCAISIIQKYIPTLPDKLIKELKNIYNTSSNKTITISKSLQASDIITTNIKLLKRNIKYLNLKIVTSLNGSTNMLGYIILDLFKNRQAVYILGKNNEIQKIRIEKLENGKFKTLLELKCHEIESFKNLDLTKILCS